MRYLSTWASKYNMLILSQAKHLQGPSNHGWQSSLSKSRKVLASTKRFRKQTKLHPKKRVISNNKSAKSHLKNYQINLWSKTKVPHRIFSFQKQRAFPLTRRIIEETMTYSPQKSIRISPNHPNLDLIDKLHFSNSNLSSELNPLPDWTLALPSLKHSQQLHLKKKRSNQRSQDHRGNWVLFLTVWTSISLRVRQERLSRISQLRSKTSQKSSRTKRTRRLENRSLISRKVSKGCRLRIKSDHLRLWGDRASFWSRSLRRDQQ